MSRISGAVNLDLSSLQIDTGELEELAGKELVQEFGTQLSLVPAVETTVASYTVPALKKVRVKGVFYEGDADAMFTLYIDGTLEWQGRNAWTDRNTKAKMEYEALAGQDIELKVTNLHNTNQNYSGGFYGFQLNS
jgi:hypothetical protein